MSLNLLAPYALKKFQLEFGDYLRSQRQSEQDNIPNRVGKIYQDLIFNNVSGFLNQCFPICKSILGEHWRTLCLYFFQRYPTHSPYFSEIPMQFVEFLSQCVDDDFDQSEWATALTIQHADIITHIPPYLPELAHYEWLELYVETLPNQAEPLILNAEKSYFLNPTIQNHYYGYPVHHIRSDHGDEIALQDTFLVVLRQDEQVKFVEVNVLTHLLLDFLQNNPVVYQNQIDLLKAFAESIEYADFDGLVAFKDDLFAMLENESIFVSK